jgi:biotin carboxyl carrier protein
VLQTLLEGIPAVRLAIDSATKRIVVLARDSEHVVINAAIEKFELQEQDAAIFSADGKQLVASVDTTADLRKRIKQLEKENELLKLDLKRLAASGKSVNRLEKQIEQRKVHPRTHSDHPQPSGVRRTQPRTSAQVDGTTIRCEVGPLNIRDMRVRSIVPAGKQVRRGDLLVELSCDSIEGMMSEQKIKLSVAESTLLQSRLDRDRTVTAAEGKQAEAQAAVNEAKTTLAAYLEGERSVDAMALEAAVKIAQLNLKHSLRPQDAAGQGRVDKIEVEKAELVLDVAKLKLDVFKRFLVPKMTQTLENELDSAKRAHEANRIDNEAQINRAEATVKAQQVLVETERSRGERLVQQLKHLRVTAPHDGMVSHVQNGPPIKEGSLVRKGQVLLVLRGGAKDKPKESSRQIGR